MSWSNPTQEEAQEAYDAAKQKYDTTAEDYLLASRRREQYESQAKSVYKAYAADDKRITGLRRLEFKLQRVCRFFNTNNTVGIDTMVTLSRVSSVELNNIIRCFMYCDEIKPPAVGPAAMSPYTENDADASWAKQLVEAELARVRELIETSNDQVKSSAEEYNKLVRLAKGCEDEMQELRKILDSCAFDMDHYKKYL